MAKANSTSAFMGLTVLVVEDESLAALELEQILEEAGCTVLGPVATVEAALNLLGYTVPGAALLDVQLLNGMITPVAEKLRSLAVPFVLVSGYTGQELKNPALANAPNVGKPLMKSRLLDALATAVETSAGSSGT